MTHPLQLNKRRRRGRSRSKRGKRHEQPSLSKGVKRALADDPVRDKRKPESEGNG